MTFEWNAPCYIRRAGWFTYANRIYYEYKTVERRYIQEEPRIKAIAKEKSHFSRKSTHFQFKHDFATTSALARCTLIWARDSPLFDFFFPTGLRLNKEKKFTGIDQALFFPHTPSILINATHSLVKIIAEQRNSLPQIWPKWQWFVVLFVYEVCIQNHSGLKRLIYLCPYQF